MIRNLLLALAANLTVTCVAAAAPPAFHSDRITVETTGAGPDVVFIPGLTSSPKVWAETVAALPGHRVHLVQLNGFAGAPAGGAKDGLVAGPAAEELARYIAEQKLQKPVLVGHSMGGSIALMVAARHPEAAGKVMIVDAMPFMGVVFGPPGSTPETLKPVAERVRQGMSGSNDADWAANLKRNVDGMVRTESRRAVPMADGLASDRDVAGRAMQELILTDLRPELKRITAPTTVLYVRPAAAPATDAQMDGWYRASYANLAGVKLTRIPEAEHFIMLDQPERFQAELKAFLAQ